MMAYLTRREKFADGSPPPKKPYNAFQFKKSTDTLLQGVYGTGKSSNAFLVDLLQKELNKAVEEGVVTMQEGLEFIKSRKKYYDNYLLEKSKTTDGPIGLPQIEERTELAGAGLAGKQKHGGYGLLKTGPNKGKYSFPYSRTIDGKRVRLRDYFDTKEEFDAAVKKSVTFKGGGARDQSKRISTPSASEIEIAETVYGDKYNKKGVELWKSLKVKERGGIRRGTTTGQKKGPESLGVTEEGKPVFQVKREKALERNAPFKIKGTKDFQFHHIMNIGGEIPLDTNDIAVISAKMNIKLAPYNKQLNNIADEISNLINTQSDGYLKKIETLNTQAEGIVKNATKQLPKEYKNLIGFNKVVPVFDENATVIDFTAKKVGGSNQKQPGIKLEDLTNKQATALRKQIKSDAISFSKAGVKDKILSSAGKVLKAAGKVIKPVGYIMGTKALFDAQALAKEQGIELSLADKAMAIDSGDPYVALDNYKRRNIPGYSEEQAGITLGKFQDDFTEVGKDSTFGKYNDQIKNIKLP